MRVLSHSLVLEHHEGVNGLHTTSCWEDQQGIDVQFVQTSIELHSQMGDVDQGLRQRLNVRRRPSTESVQHAGPFDVGQHCARFRLGNGTATQSNIVVDFDHDPAAAKEDGRSELGVIGDPRQ